MGENKNHLMIEKNNNNKVKCMHNHAQHITQLYNFKCFNTILQYINKLTDILLASGFCK